MLSGVIGSLLAAGLPPLIAAAAGAHLHGRAGERAQAAGQAGAQALWDHLRSCLSRHPPGTTVGRGLPSWGELPGGGARGFRPRPRPGAARRPGRGGHRPGRHRRQHPALLADVRRHNPVGELMAVVKADGYGHGAVPAARAALRGGAGQLGVATPTEALELRAAGIDAPLLAWLWPAGEDVARRRGAGVDLGVSSLAHLDAVLARAVAGVRRAIHLKIDTGLGRNGVGPAELGGVLAALAAAAARPAGCEVAGLMSHLASADVPGDPSVAEQTAAFRDALGRGRAAGIRAAIPAPGEHAGRDRPPGDLLRPRRGAASGSTGSTRCARRPGCAPR